jgi:hypothetical protein
MPPLSEYEENLLFEIYQIPRTARATTYIGGANYFGSTDFPTDNRSKEQLEEALVSINTSSAKVRRVKEILEEYMNFSTDPSNIDSKGYSFRAGKSLAALQRALQPYTGILISTRNSNRVNLG